MNGWSSEGARSRPRGEGLLRCEAAERALEELHGDVRKPVGLTYGDGWWACQT